jgi:putative ABC transport system substrate-binding protein
VKARRDFLIAGCAGLSVLAMPIAAFAQRPSAKLHRIGFLGPTSSAAMASRLEALRAGLRDLGYVEDKNLVIEFRWADGNYDRLPALAAELVRLKVDVIVTHSVPGARAAKQATKTIPIVFAPVGDAVTTGLVENLARPGGNITGSSFFTPELNAKRLELLKDAFPRIRRIAFLFNLNNPATPLAAMETAAASLKVELQQFGMRSPNDLEDTFAAITKRGAEAVAVHDDPMLLANVGTIARLTAKHRIRSIGFTELAEAGGLMAYGVNLPAMARKAAVQVDKVLKGANPGDLPIERATNFDLIINRKTAEALGIKIPQSILVRADRVIE